MIKASLNKQECPYCREKLLKNKSKNKKIVEVEVYDDDDDDDDEERIDLYRYSNHRTDEVEIVEIEEVDDEEIETDDDDELEIEEIGINDDYEVEIDDEIEFSEDDDSDSDYQPESNNRNYLKRRTNSDFFKFKGIDGEYYYSYIKKRLQYIISDYLFGRGYSSAYVNKFKNCNLRLFKEIPIKVCDISKSESEVYLHRDEVLNQMYYLFFKDSNDVYSFAKKVYNKENKRKNKKKLEKKYLNKAIERIKSIAIKVKKSTKNKKEKINTKCILKF
jgi:hypothetical protein